MIRTVSTVAAMLAVLSSAPVLADEIGDSIKEAQEAYDDGDLATAKQALDYASQLIAQQNAEKLTQALPDAPDGWAVEGSADRTQAGGAFGGGIQASRTYRKGDDYVEIVIAGDSPMLAQWLPMMSNPQLAGAMGKIIKVGKQRAIQGSSGDVTMVVGTRFLVSVTGGGPGESKLELAHAIDLKKLEDF